MKPLLQGQLDGLCGVYSSINATRLIAKISQDQAESLFNRMIKLIRERKDFSRVLANGISTNDLSYLFPLIERSFPLNRYKPFHQSKNTPLDLYWRKVQGFLEEDRRSVIMAIGSHTWAHWTVVRKATDKTLILFDSDRIKTLKRKRCTTTRISRARPIQIYPTLTYFLSRRD